MLIDPLREPRRPRALPRHEPRSAAPPQPDPSPLAAEHDEPWPGGRANHYLFDMNRDWFAQSQPETRGRLRVFLEWFPQVAVDLHEMGGDSTYFFAPPGDAAQPLPPAPSSASGWRRSAARSPRRFDARGSPTSCARSSTLLSRLRRVLADDQGAVGMTFEQASARGLVWRREDGTRLTYRDGIRDHFRAALTTVEAAAAGPREAAARLPRVPPLPLSARASEGVGARVRARRRAADPARPRRLAELLVAQGIEVRRRRAASCSAGGRAPSRPAAASCRWPSRSAAWCATCSSRSVAMDEAFVKEQERRRKKRLPDQIYDVTAWSLPLAVRRRVRRPRPGPR